MQFCLYYGLQVFIVVNFDLNVPVDWVMGGVFHSGVVSCPSKGKSKLLATCC